MTTKHVYLSAFFHCARFSDPRWSIDHENIEYSMQSKTLYAILLPVLYKAVSGVNIASYLSGYCVPEHNFTELVLPPDLPPETLTLCAAGIGTEVISCTSSQLKFIRLPGILMGIRQIEIGLFNSPMNQLTNINADIAAATEIINISYHITEVVNYPLNPRYTIRIESPAYGATIESQQLSIEMTTVADLYNNYRFSVLGFPDSVMPSTMQTLQSMNTIIEPGSWFYSITPMYIRSTTDEAGNVVNADIVYGYPKHSYMEFVLPEAEIQKLRYYRDHAMLVNEVEVRVDSSQTFSYSTNNEGAGTTMLCIWSGDQIDGQRRIWLQQTEHLNSSQFAFTWLISFEQDNLRYLQSRYDTDPKANHLYAHLRRLNSTQGNIFIDKSPALAVTMEDLQQSPGDNRLPASALWGGNSTFLYWYVHESLLIANYSIDKVTPAWCRQFYINMRTSMQNAGCEVNIYGNDRHFTSNVLITDTSRVLGIPSVAELANNFVDPHTVPSVIVAPSAFALQHDGVQSLLRDSAGAKQLKVRAVVIPPGVDTAVFDPDVVAACQKPVYKHPGCVGTSAEGSTDSTNGTCIVIGYLARLSHEKSPGLFLQAAYEILRLHPFARFTVVGDGALRASLEALAARLQISWAVHFTGWVGAEDLPQLLAGLDIVINTSLWPETFCIANIEVISMEVPLVTFAVGGIGEYVQDPQLSTSNAQDSSKASRAAGLVTVPDYSVSSNAVVVNRASPSALAQAVQHLILHPAVRRSIGRAGRQTVQAHFTVQRQMRSYIKLYTALTVQP